MIRLIFCILAVVALVIECTAAPVAIAAKPAMAWNTWNKFACNVSETLMKSAADKLLELELDQLGYTSVNLDDCWQNKQRDSLGNLRADPSRFPSGLTSLGVYLHSRGLRFGIYSSAGFFTCAANASFPASLGLEMTDASTFAQWGIDYLKYDNCMEDKGLPTVRYPPMSQALQTSGRDVYYSICEWGRENPAVWAASIGASSWRVSQDISDNWMSIITRANTNAPLWRYAGAAYRGGWNDIDMLEVGNGGCTDEEYKSHFSLWAIMKSPLILGMDLDTVTLDSPTYAIISNKEVIAVNQDSSGFQARRVWSDKMDNADHVIATKCTSQVAPWPLQDAFEDQMWTLRSDGRIESSTTGRCLQEVSTADLELNETELNTDLLKAADDGLLAMDTNIGPMNLNMDLRKAFGVAVRTTDCESGTQFGFFDGIGGSIISQQSGLCLEVSTEMQFPLWQGKRLQTNKCDNIQRDGPDHSMTATHGRDSQEHQSWVLERRSSANVGQLKNLYQRQCLTVDRDAPKGNRLELWQGSLSDGVGGYVLLLLNLAEKAQKDVSINPDMMQIPSHVDVSGYTVRDLWAKTTFQMQADGSILVDTIASHGVVMLRISAPME